MENHVHSVYYYLFFQKLGEVSLGLNRGDVTPVVAPDQAPALDIQNEKRRGGARH